MCDDDDDDESCNKCYALRVVFKRRDLKKNVSCVFVRKKGCVFFDSFLKCRHTCVAVEVVFIIRSFNNNSNYICTRKRSWYTHNQLRQYLLFIILREREE